MATRDTQGSKSPSELIELKIKELGDWRGEMLSRIRHLIKQTDPDVIEEWKWRGVPVWSHHGLICTGETYKNVVKMTFAKGAALADPTGLFNASLEGNTRRAIDLRQGERIDEEALKTLIGAEQVQSPDINQFLRLICWTARGPSPRVIAVNAVPFDTLKLARQLEAAGFSAQQAAGAAAALVDAMSSSDFATKADLVVLKTELVSAMDSRFSAQDAKNETRFAGLENKIELLRRDMTIKLGGMIFVAVGVILAGMRFMPHP